MASGWTLLHLYISSFCSSIPTSYFFVLVRKKNAKSRVFFTSRGAHVNGAIIAMLYTYSIGNQL